MNVRLFKRVTTNFLVPMVLLCGTSAAAQEVQQILDRVFAFNDIAALEMAFSDPDRLADFSVVLNAPGANFSACKLTSTRGLWCLDGKTVVNLPDTSDPGSLFDVLSCEDPTLDLDTRKENTCTGLTVDSSVAIYLAGKEKGKKHSLIKVVEKDSGGACPAGFTALIQSPGLCARMLASGRPLLIDINPIDGEAAAQFNPACPTCIGTGKGTLGLEERTAAVFFPDSGAPAEIADRQDWDLKGNEKLFSIALLQLPDTSGGFDSLVLATTTKDRILAVETDGTPDVITVFDIAAERNPSSVQCAFDEQHYGIRTSFESGIVYVTDHNYCQVLALQPVVDGTSGQLLALTNVQEENSILTLSDLTLSTATTSESFPPDFPTVAPGVAIDLTECEVACTLVDDDAGDPAAILSNVTLVGSESGMTLYQIQGIPDCRYAIQFCIDFLDNVNSAADLKSEGIVFDPTIFFSTDPDTVAAQFLNVTPLLPLAVTDNFSEGLPNLWIPRWYRGQEDNNFFFDAFFGITDATFEGVFELEFFVAALTGLGELGCTENRPENTDVSVLREWDVALTVSEDFISIDRDKFPDSEVHEAMLTNTGCGSSRNGGTRWSFLPINMEIPEDTWDEVSSLVTADDDAVFAKLLISLTDDLRASISELACAAADGQSSAPLSTEDCSALDNQWLVMRDKLDKCIDATKVPKSSSRNQTCQAFETQLSHFIDLVTLLTPSGDDPANRIGELLVRLQVIENVYFNLFFPSIPDEGFQGL